MINIIKKSIQKSEILRYLGYPENYVDTNTNLLIDNLIDKCLLGINPRFVYLTFPATFDSNNNLVYLDGSNLVLSGQSVYTHLYGSSKIVCLAATMGIEAEKNIKMATYNDLTSSLIMDAIYNECIEKLCDTAETKIKDDDLLKDMYSSTRFSPGYGDLPLSIQPAIIQVLKAEKTIGLTCSKNNLLIPRKSVTAFIGFSDKNIYNNMTTTCDLCELKKNCKLRKAGKYCGLKKDNGK